MLSLSFVIGLLVSIQTAEGVQGENLALYKEAKQSTTLSLQYNASKAVNGQFTQLDFSHTNQTGIRWWTVDLGKRYSIGQIKLYNRKDCCQNRLANITTLTSTVDSPTDPSLNSDEWVTRAYRGPAYANVGIIDFKPSVRARHVAVYSSADPQKILDKHGVAGKAALTLLEVEVFAQDNLAHKKQASQSSTEGNDVAANAVNGIYTDLSKTGSESVNWWRVDLEKKYSIGAIELYGEPEFAANLEQVDVLTSNHEAPGAPGLGSAEWNQKNGTRQRHDEFVEITFTDPTEGRHVAVYCGMLNQPLSLSEVVVYDYNYALSKQTAQNGNHDEMLSGYAVDGDLTTFSSTSTRTNQWWKVDLQHLIQLRSVAVYVRNGTCNSGTTECSSRLNNVYFLTNNANTNASPSTTVSGGWETCYSNRTAQGDSYKIGCSSNGTPLTRLFSILTTNPSAEVGLREVELFGNEAAQLTEEVDWNIEDSTYTSVTVSFLRWSKLMIGVLPPTGYKITVKYDGNSKASNNVTHIGSPTRPTSTFRQLEIGREYEITLECFLEDSIRCEGATPKFKVTTKSCTDPAKANLTFTISSVTNGQRERWMYSYTWKAPEPNCPGTVSYTYSGPGTEVQSTDNTSATFIIDGYQTFTFNVISINQKGLKSSAVSSERSPPLRPQFGSSEFTLPSTNSSCVQLSWADPEFLGGPKEDITYEFTCGEDDKWTVAARSPAGSCGHEPVTNVTCKLRALNGELKSDNQIATALTLEKEEISTVTPKSQIATIAGSAAGAAVVFLLIFGVVLFIIRRQKKSDSDKSGSDDFAPVEKTNIQPPATPARNNSVTKPRREPPRGAEAEEIETAIDECAYGNADTVPKGQSEAIPVGRLAWYNKTNIPLIRTQYQDLEKLPKPNMSIALQQENKGKCRYKGLYPSNKHRVKLQPSYPGETDFINATYLQAYSVDNHFIAAQGPFTDAVVKDFWLMIWQQRPSAIVMVTKAIENAKVKCLQYYPLEVGTVETFGEFKVTLKSTEACSDFATNSLLVQRGDETRIIPHFNYVGWPDHGVPDIEVFVSFHRLVKSGIYRNFSQPVLIHCSAGVGRTGTYVALDYLLDQAKMEGVVDMFECVREMRTRRPCMIQTVDQYEFLHHVLYESLSTKGFSCNSGKLANKINVHATQPGSKEDVISAEYEHIQERIQSVSLTYKTARAPANRKKNRYSEMLPSDEHMPFLTNGAQGNYINAAIVDGYREKKQWIATQLPLSHTVGDFWQLQTEQGIHIVVQLEMSQTPFYPMMDSTDLVAGSILIKRHSSTDSDHVMTISLEVESKEAKETIYVLVLKNWEKNCLPPSQMIIDLHLAVEKLQQQTGSRRVTATCMDGSKRCGLYICTHNAIEKLKVEQDVDVYYPTVMAKLCRPQFVSLIEQYSHIYQIIQDYIDAFSEYSNFQ